MSSVTHTAGRLLVLAMAASLAAACTAPGASSGGAASGNGTAASPPTSPVPSPALTRPPEVKPGGATVEPTQPSSENELPPAVVEEARTALAAIVGAEAAAGATVVSAEAVSWPDGSLGCPEPGMMYTQAIVPGYQVVFEVDGETYDMHASQAGSFSRCESGRPLPG